MITRKRRKKTATAAKKTVRRRKRRNPVARKRRTVRTAAPVRRRKRRNPVARKRRVTRAAAPVRRRKRRNPAARKRRTVRTASPVRRRKRRVYRRNPHPAAMTRARRGMRRRMSRRMRSNPRGGFMDSVKMVLPFGASLYGSRFVTGMVQTRLMPMLPLPIGAQYHRPIAAAAVMAGMHFASKRVGALKRHSSAVMVGAGLNLLDSVLAAFAPASIKSMLGVGDIYDGAMGDYLEVGDYVQVGDAPPIDDDITMADYVEVGLDEELGMGVEEELGLEEELGADTLSRPLLGGVPRSSMLAPIRSAPMLQSIPARSFTKRIPRAGAGYDKNSVLYGGIFAGGW